MQSDTGELWLSWPVGVDSVQMTRTKFVINDLFVLQLFWRGHPENSTNVSGASITL